MQLKGAGNMRKKQAALEIPAYVRETLTALETAGHQAYCVGGCVRDSLLGRTPEDWDVTTSALPEETMKVFGDRAIPTGLKHGTVTVCCQEGKVETTTFRRDGVYAPPKTAAPDRPRSAKFPLAGPPVRRMGHTPSLEGLSPWR